VEHVSFSPGAILLTGVEMPRYGLTADTVWVFPAWDPLPTSIRRVVVPSCSLIDPAGPSRASAGGGRRSSLPSVEIGRALVVLEGDSTVAGGWLGEGGYCVACAGRWGSVVASGSTGGGETSVTAVFEDVSGLPGGLPGCPPAVSGHRFSGMLAGSLGSDSILVGGVVAELDGEESAIPFRAAGAWEGTLHLEAEVDLGSLQPVIEARILALDPRAAVDVVPVGQATLSYDAAEGCAFHLVAEVDDAKLFSPMLASDTVRFDASADLSGRLAEGILSVDSGAVSLGGIALGVQFEATPAGRYTLRLANPSISAAALDSSIPPALLGRLRGTTVTGTLGIDARLVLDASCPESCDVDIGVDVSDLEVTSCPVQVSRFARGGSVVMHDSWGGSREIVLDPVANPGFVTMESFPGLLEALVLCAEDGSFRSHSGFSPDHIRSAMQANVRRGRFVRGASTITMQLARNLFLGRERTLARKFQEVFLTWRLESALSKDRILEIYLNIVEMGPGVYGFPEAASYYFGTGLDRLEPRQMAFLVTILPGPRLYHRFFEAGEVPAWWESGIDLLLRAASRRGAIPREAAEAACGRRTIFGAAPP